MHVSEQPNYSWLEAKSLAQKLGRTAKPNVEAYFRSESDFVIRAEGGWRTWNELPKRHSDWRDGMDPWTVSIRSSPWANSQISSDPFDPAQIIIFQPAPVNEDQRAYSNPQFAMSRPHEDFAVIVSSCTYFEMDGDEAVGVLSDLGAQLPLVRDGRMHINAVKAGGTFRLLVRDGAVTRYQLHLDGILFVDRERVQVHQRSTTAIRAVGETQWEVPAEVRRKRGR